MYMDQAPDWTAMESWFDSRQGQGIFLFSKTPRPVLNPPSPLFNEYRGYAPARVKTETCNSDHSFLSVILITTNKMQLFLIYLFITRSTCFRRFLLPSSGAMRWNWNSSISSTIPASRSIGWKYLKPCVQFCAPDDGRRNRLKHVQRFRNK